MIEPLLSDDALLAELERPAATPGELAICWLGQSGFWCRWENTRVLFDPYLSDSLTEKYAATDKPHTRMSRRVISPERLTALNVITSSHNHTDHLDAATLLPLLRVNPAARLVIPEANRSFVAQRLAIAPAYPDGLDDGLEIALGDSGQIRIAAAAAAHNTLERDAAGRHHFLGYTVQLGPWRIYHSGDTLLYDGLAEKLRVRGPFDVAFVPINGNRPERRVAGNLDGREAAQLARDIGARLAVPHHYAMFEFNTADPAALFEPECVRLAQPSRTLRLGEVLRLPASACCAASAKAAT
jgi:L-ascorbate metabolism protein UlaG (beta-lactamase superfamily)